jgi:hypothetical protein
MVGEEVFFVEMGFGWAKAESFVGTSDIWMYPDVKNS